MQTLVRKLIVIIVVLFFPLSKNLYAQSFFGGGGDSEGQKNEQPSKTTPLTPQEYKNKVDALTKEYEKELRQRASTRFVKPTPLPPSGNNPPPGNGSSFSATQHGTSSGISGAGQSTVFTRQQSTSPPPAEPQPALPPQTEPPPTLQAPTQSQPATGSSTVSSPRNQPSYTGFGTGNQGTSPKSGGSRSGIKY